MFYENTSRPIELPRIAKLNKNLSLVGQIRRKASSLLATILPSQDKELEKLRSKMGIGTTLSRRDWKRNSAFLFYSRYQQD